MFNTHIVSHNQVRFATVVNLPTQFSNLTKRSLSKSICSCSMLLGLLCEVLDFDLDEVFISSWHCAAWLNPMLNPWEQVSNTIPLLPVVCRINFSCYNLLLFTTSWYRNVDQGTAVSCLLSQSLYSFGFSLFKF